MDRATHGNPGKLSFCFAEDEAPRPGPRWRCPEGCRPAPTPSPCSPARVPAPIVDQKSRDPESLATTFAECLRAMHHPKLVMAFDALVVVGPEHARVFGEAGWDRDRTVREINERTARPGAELIEGRAA